MAVDRAETMMHCLQQRHVALNVGLYVHEDASFVDWMEGTGWHGMGRKTVSAVTLESSKELDLSRLPSYRPTDWHPVSPPVHAAAPIVGLDPRPHSPSLSLTPLWK